MQWKNVLGLQIYDQEHSHCSLIHEDQIGGDVDSGVAVLQNISDQLSEGAVRNFKQFPRPVFCIR